MHLGAMQTQTQAFPVALQTAVLIPEGLLPATVLPGCTPPPPCQVLKEQKASSTPMTRWPGTLETRRDPGRALEPLAH